MASRAEHYGLWREHLKELAASGLSREAYCAWHGLSRSTLYRWEQRLRGEPVRPRVRAAFEQMHWIAVQVAPDAQWPWSTSGC
jgi:hypothetical protein